MRGLGLLWILILGFACCANPIRAYYYEGDQEFKSSAGSAPELRVADPGKESMKLGSAQESAVSSASAAALDELDTGEERPSATSSVAEAQNAQEKREMNLGMPGPIEPKADAMDQQGSIDDLGPPAPMDGMLELAPTNPTPPSASRAFGGAFSQGEQSSQQPQQQQQPQQPHQQQPNPQQPSQQPDQVPVDHLPTIIENDKKIVPQIQPMTDSQQQSGTPAIQYQQQNNQQPSGLQTTGLQPVQTMPASAQATSLADPNKPQSTARTFDSWTNCVGAQSGKYGTCKNDVECNKSKGRGDGSCMGGFGVCCVMALSCNEKSLENNTFFANPDFPEPSWEARLCEVEVKKKHKGILQVMIEFEEFELAPPNHEGECITDVFQVKLASNRPSPYSLLRVCGQNTGQHMYLDVSQIDEPLVLSVATSGGGFPRRWSVRIVQMDEKNFLLAPPGCLQYYTDTVGHFRSFNLGKNLRNLYYAICFRIDNGYSGIRFTSNFFGMNGPNCRRKSPGGGGGPQGYGGRYNGSIEAHPHHLVIPPPGYAPPPPKPKFQHHMIHNLEPIGHQHGKSAHHHPSHQGGRFRRFAYAETSERLPRTLPHEHELFEEKEFKHHDLKLHEFHKQLPPPQYQQGSYGPQGGYGPPPPPPQAYGYGPGYDSKKEEFAEKLGKHSGYKQEPSSSSKLWGWTSSLGFGEKKEAKQEAKYSGQSGYLQSGHGYLGQKGYEQPPIYGQPPSYGRYPGIHGPQPGYGEYHHKEIDKFGKKYELLEHKHEKNHLGKEEKSSSWWPLWGKKDEKLEKKEKYFQHHEALFPMMHIPEMPHCEPRFCGSNDVITFPPSGDSIAEMCGNRFNRGRGPKIISGSPLVVYVSNRGAQRGSGFDMNYEQVFYIPKPY